LVKARDREVAILRSEALKKEEEIRDQNNRIVVLNNDIESKDVVISTLKMQEMNSLDKIYYNGKKSDEFTSDLSSTISLE